MAASYISNERPIVLRFTGRRHQAGIGVAPRRKASGFAPRFRTPVQHPGSARRVPLFLQSVATGYTHPDFALDLRHFPARYWNGAGNSYQEIP